MCRSGLAMKLGLMVSPTGKEGDPTLVDVGCGRPRRKDPGASALEKLLSACSPLAGLSLLLLMEPQSVVPPKRASQQAPVKPWSSGT